MESEHDYELVLTDEEQSVLNKAIKLLKPLNTETVSNGITDFREEDEEGGLLEFFGIEYDCCNNDACVSEMINRLKTEHPGKQISPRYLETYVEFDHIGRCAICTKPFNEYMTEIGIEFHHYNMHKPSLEDLQKHSNTAFDLIAIFQSFPSQDEVIDKYDLHHKSIGVNGPFDRKMKRIEDFKKSVLGLANHIIDILEINKDNG